MIRLYGYWRSSAAYRVRIALNLKGIEYEYVPVNLLRDGGEHRREEYRQLNPQQLVPTLVDGDVVLSQSVAIIEYLDEIFQARPLLPRDSLKRARVRQAALSIACDIHPLNNSGVLSYLKNELHADGKKIQQWYQHWILKNFPALEDWAQANRAEGKLFAGNEPGLADICLIPQVYNARRFKVFLDNFPNLLEIDRHCNELKAFKQAAPEAQADANTD